MAKLEPRRKIEDQNQPGRSVPPSTGAGQTPASGSAAGGGFDMGSFQASLAEQNRLTAERQAQQIMQQAQQADIMNRSKDLAAKQVSSLQFMRDDMATAQQKMQHARQLADSNNPLDTLQLMGLQFLDPNGYVRKNREERLREDSMQVAIQSQMYGIGQEALKQELLASTAGVDKAALLENIGMEKLKSFSANAALMHEQVSALNTMKQDVIQPMDVKALAAAVSQSQAPGANGVANIAGVDVDTQTLRERLSDMQDREYTMQMRAYTQRLGQYDIDNVEQELAAKAADSKLKQDKIQNIDSEIMLQKAERTARLDAALTASQERYLRTATQQEILAIRANNNMDEAGNVYNPALLDQAYDQRTKLVADKVNEAVMQSQLNNFDMNSLASEQQRLATLKPRLTPNSPAAKAADQYQRVIGFSALGAGQDAPLESRIVAQSAFEKAGQQFEATLAAQAKAEAKGDKNVEEMRLEYYRGNPVPQDALINAATDRLTKFKSVADIFPQKTAAIIESRYRELSQQIVARDPASMNNKSAEDIKIEKANAVTEAINFGVNQELAGRTETLLSGQVLAENHPLKGRWGPAQILGELKKADDVGMQSWMKANNLSQEDAAQIQAGTYTNPDPNKNMAALNQDLIYRQNSQFLMQMNAYESGLGHDIATWWQLDSPAYVAAQQQTDENRNSNNFQSNNFRAVRGEIEGRSMNEYGLSLIQADDKTSEELAQRNTDFVTFSGDPNNAQVTLLGLDKNLSDSEKQLVYTQVIQPLLKVAQAKGMSFRDTNLLVEREIMNYDGTDPQTRSVMKTLRRERPNILDGLQNTFSFTQYFTNPFGMDQLEGNLKGLGWYQQLVNSPTNQSAIVKRPMPSPK